MSLSVFHLRLLAPLPMVPLLLVAGCGGPEPAADPEQGPAIGTLTHALSGTLVSIGRDPGTGSCRHKTAIGPDIVGFGSRLGAAFQLGTCTDIGANNIGFAISTNGGSTWTSGTLSLGSYPRGDEPAIAYSARQNAWLLTWIATDTAYEAVALSRSTDDGAHWSAPVLLPATNLNEPQLPWLACDNTSTRCPG